MHKLVYWSAMIALGWLGCAESGPPREPDYTGARQRMVEVQIAGREIRNPRVLEAMRTVPRHEFVPEDQRAQAYEDHPLPIGYDQTISQPYIVAYMTEQLAPKPGDRVLEIGAGSGYQAAVLSKLVAEVYSMEIVEPLARRAEETCRRVGCTNVFVKAGDGYLGWPEKAPFDAVIVTCAPEKIPPHLLEQLKEGGRMIIPVGPAFNQQLIRLVKTGGEVRRQAVLPVRFVPMTGRAQQSKP